MITLHKWLPILMSNFTFYGGMLGGGKQKTTASNAPWSGAQPYILDAIGQAKDLANVQSPSTIQTQPYDMVKRLANNGDPMNQSANDLNNQTLSGAFLSPDSSPYLKQNVNTALDAVQSRVNSQFNGNNYGSSANQETLTRNLADTASQMYGQNYTNERGNQMQAMNLTPTLNQNRYTDANQLSQSVSDEAEAPWKALKNYAQIIGLGSGGGQSTSTSSASSSPLSTIAGLGFMGAGLMSKGAIFSDERLKSNIKRVGTHPLGIGVYDYDKFGKRERGLLAQEVEEVMPEAVTEHESGMKKVDYGLLG